MTKLFDHVIGGLLPDIFRRKTSVPCNDAFSENSQPRLYNTAFEMTPNPILQNWQYNPFTQNEIDDRVMKVDSMQSCVNLSYVSAFEDPEILLHVDPTHISIQKKACVAAGNSHEQIVISNIPFFK